MLYEELTGEILGAAIEVHRVLGPGLLESAYEQCLAHELEMRDISFERQVPIKIQYKGIEIDQGYRADLIVDKKIVVELKSVDAFAPVHEAQILTYLKLANKKVGLLINFNVTVLKEGIKRYVR